MHYVVLRYAWLRHATLPRASLTGIGLAQRRFAPECVQGSATTIPQHHRVNLPKVFGNADPNAALRIAAQLLPRLFAVTRKHSAGSSLIMLEAVPRHREAGNSALRQKHVILGCWLTFGRPRAVMSIRKILISGSGC